MTTVRPIMFDALHAARAALDQSLKAVSIGAAEASAAAAYTKVTGVECSARLDGGTLVITPQAEVTTVTIEIGIAKGPADAP